MLRQENKIKILKKKKRSLICKIWLSEMINCTPTIITMCDRKRKEKSRNFVLHPTIYLLEKRKSPFPFQIGCSIFTENNPPLHFIKLMCKYICNLGEINILLFCFSIP